MRRQLFFNQTYMVFIRDHVCLFSSFLSSTRSVDLSAVLQSSRKISSSQYLRSSIGRFCASKILNRWPQILQPASFFPWTNRSSSRLAKCLSSNKPGMTRKKPKKERHNSKSVITVLIFAPLFPHFGQGRNVIFSPLRVHAGQVLHRQVWEKHRVFRPYFVQILCGLRSDAQGLSKAPSRSPP